MVLSSQVCVILSTGMGVCLFMACITGRMTEGGGPSFWGGGVPSGGSAGGSPCRQTPPPPPGIRSIRGRYASYWNAFLFDLKIKLSCVISRSISTHFTHREQLLTPLQLTSLLGKIDIEATSTGPTGGASLAGALRLGISRALTSFVDKNTREQLRLGRLQCTSRLQSTSRLQCTSRLQRTSTLV